MRVVEGAFALVLLGTLLGGCLGQDPGGPNVLEAYPLDPSLTIVEAEGSADDGGLHATLRTAGPLRQDWLGNYEVRFEWLEPRDGVPGSIDFVRYSGFGEWDEEAGVWSFGWWMEDRWCEECAVRAVQLHGQGQADGDRMSWTIPYANASHADLAFTVRFASHLMSEGGCDYDLWPYEGWERSQFCPASMGAARPLDDAALAGSWETPGDLGPQTVRWALDADQAVLDFHYDGPALQALKRHTLYARLSSSGLDRWEVDASATDVDTFLPGDARLEAALPPPGGAGQWDRLDARGSRIEGDVLHLQWAFPGDRVLPQASELRVSFALIDPDLGCTARWHGLASDRWDLPPDCLAPS